MYNIKDVVVYGTDGLCTIVDITEKKFGNTSEEYYMLTPLSKKSNIVYVPKHNDKILLRMRKALTSSEADEFVNSLPQEYLEWTPNERERQREYKDILLYGNPEDLFIMIRSLYDRQDKQTSIGKKLHASDERYLRNAERMLFEELAYALDITQSEVLAFLIKRQRQIEKQLKKM